MQHVQHEAEHVASQRLATNLSGSQSQRLYSSFEYLHSIRHSKKSASLPSVEDRALREMMFLNG